MDDVDYLVEDNAMDDLAYHRKWMGPMVGPLLKMILTTITERAAHGNWHNGGASWEQNANAGNDSGDSGRTQQYRANSLFARILALPRELRAIPVSADDNT